MKWRYSWGVSLFGVLGLIGLIILVFDLSYLFWGIRCTYLRGETSAQIDDAVFFNNRVVMSGNGVQFLKSKKYTNSIVNEDLEQVLIDSKSVGFLILKDDSLVVEKYWDGFSKESLSNSFSMAKSITSIVLGAAIKDGYIDGVNQNISEFIPEVKNFDNQKPVKIKHLVGMSSGLDWLENYKRPISVTAKAYYGSNLENLILNRKFIRDPGTHFNYISGDTQLLGVLLERAVGERLADYTSRVLWSKLGAENDALWTLDSREGLEKTFCCFNSTLRDFAKIGRLILNEGKVGDLEIIDVDYFKWLLSAPRLINYEKNNGEYIEHYSNSWWLANVKGKKIIYARGFLGQYIVIIPELNIVFVRLGRHENDKSELNNDYMLTDNLKFFIETVINDFEY